MKMKFLMFLSCAALLAANSVQAQERAAGGAMETQMTWSALSAQIAGVTTKLDGANSRIDQIVVCGKQGKIYAPNVTGASPQGCIEASSTGGTNLTTIVNTLTTLSNNVTTLNNNVNTLNTNLTNVNNTVTTNNTNIINCGKNGGVYDGTKCVTPKTPTPEDKVAQCTMASVPATSGSCPKGYGGYIQTGVKQASNSSQGSWGDTRDTGFCFKITCK